MKPAEGQRVSRRRFMAVSGGSVAAAALLAACGEEASGSGETSQFGDGDAGILNYALTLEYVEAALYAELRRSGLLQGKAAEIAAEFGEEEEEHIAALTKGIEELDGEPAERPRTKFELTDREGSLRTASEVENLVASAYLGQLPNFTGRKPLHLALRIHSVEGRHAATANELLGRPITPDGAFAKPAKAAAVLKSIEPFMAP